MGLQDWYSDDSGLGGFSRSLWSLPMWGYALATHANFLCCVRVCSRSPLLPSLWCVR